jgi:hypothetical protein
MSHDVVRAIDRIVSPCICSPAKRVRAASPGEYRYCLLTGFSLTNMYLVFAQFETGLV